MAETRAELARIVRAGQQGMITLRGDLADPAIDAAVAAAIGAGLPARRSVATGSGGMAAWMAPDEALLLVDHAAAHAVATRLQTACGESFATAVDVSDARALFHVEGQEAPAALAKLCPVDTARLAPGEIRRTRCAQVAAAIWRSEAQAFRLICFRSVAVYVHDLLTTAARPGGEVGRF